MNKEGGGSIDHAFLATVTEGLSQAQWPVVYGCIADLYGHEVGYRLMTISAIDIEATAPVRRLWSSNEAVFPIGGRKPLGTQAWRRTVLDELSVMVCDGEAELASAFDDHTVLRDLGCASGINVPIVVARRVVGSVNLFNELGWYTPQRVERARQLSAWIYAPLLASCHVLEEASGDRA